MENHLFFQKSNDDRTAVYKQLLGDHRKITDKYKSIEKDLGFTKSECSIEPKHMYFRDKISWSSVSYSLLV